MLSLKKSCSKSSNFKQNLWGQVSSECSGGLWCYSFSERRLFLVLSVLTIVLIAIYFTGRVQEIKGLQTDINNLNSINTKKLDQMYNPPQNQEDKIFNQDNNE